jgi:hypothetical protein
MNLSCTHPKTRKPQKSYPKRNKITHKPLRKLFYLVKTVFLFSMIHLICFLVFCRQRNATTKICLCKLNGQLASFHCGNQLNFGDSILYFVRNRVKYCEWGQSILQRHVNIQKYQDSQTI